MFLLDCGTNILLLVGSNVPPTILQNVFGNVHFFHIFFPCSHKILAWFGYTIFSHHNSRPNHGESCVNKINEQHILFFCLVYKTERFTNLNGFYFLGVSSVNEIPDLCFELPNTRTPDCDNLHSFLEAINVEKPYIPPIQIIRYVIKPTLCSKHIKTLHKT